jgi:small subunit ribosomal protein S13
MARIKNVELPNNKKTYIGLTHIYGIGQATAKDICLAAKVDENKKIGELSNDEIASLRTEIDKHMVEGDLRREVQTNIKNKMEIGSYQGSRHKKGLPVHGQRTNRNARTRKGKGKVVANKKKVGK